MTWEAEEVNSGATGVIEVTEAELKALDIWMIPLTCMMLPKKMAQETRSLTEYVHTWYRPTPKPHFAEGSQKALLFTQSWISR